MKLLPAVPPPELPTILSREYAFVPDHNLQKTAIRPDTSINKSLQQSHSAGTVPSLQVIRSSALQSSSALLTTTLRKDTLHALLLLDPHNKITGARPKLGIHVLRTEGGRELLIIASDIKQQNQLQTDDILHIKYTGGREGGGIEMLMFVTAVSPSELLP